MQRYVARHEATEIVEPLRHSIDFARQHFVDEEYGGWYLSPPGAGGEPSLVKGNVYKLDYHVVNMCRELLANRCSRPPPTRLRRGYSCVC